MGGGGGKDRQQQQQLVAVDPNNDDHLGLKPPTQGEHYTLIRKIGEGSFGVIYVGTSDLCSEYVAIKFESRKSSAPQLRDEYRAYKLLNSAIQADSKNKQTPVDADLTSGIPRVHFFGQQTHFNYLILDLLGRSLEDIFDRCGRKFSVKTVCYLAIEMISRVQIIHRHGLIFRDIKPDNFLLGRGSIRRSVNSLAKNNNQSSTAMSIPSLKQMNSNIQLNSDQAETSLLASSDESGAVVNGSLQQGDGNGSKASSNVRSQSSSSSVCMETVYVVDFGMAKHYRDPRTLQHIPYREKKSLSGTARYMSINTHLGREQSRRDDLEALGNVFMYFLRGSLPWQGLKARDNREKYERIGQRKQFIRVEDLCAGFPSAFERFVAYSRRLKFEEEPDYEMLKGWFREALAEQDSNELMDWQKHAAVDDEHLICSPAVDQAVNRNRNASTTARKGHDSGAATTTAAGGGGRSPHQRLAPIGGNVIVAPVGSDQCTSRRRSSGFFRRLFGACS